MNNNIFIPKKINVGFQNRSDTYTKKLAYIIYYDEKGKLRKETSWNSWRDKKIEPIEFENVPTSGFVLNKKAGGYSTGWNHRQTYCRVYDSRDFEFEITISNLLYILENTNSIKGKGLDGEFIYGWDGKDLLLVPCDSPDYIDLSKFNEILHNKETIKAKDLILGATYQTKQNEEWIYMGKFDYYDWKGNGGKQFWFYNNANKGFYQIKKLGDKLIKVIDSEYCDNYAELFDEMECRSDYSPYDSSKDKYESRDLDEFTQYIIKPKEYRWEKKVFFGEYNGKYELLQIKKYSDLDDENLKFKDGYYVRLKSEDSDYTYNYGYYSSSSKREFKQPLFEGTIEKVFSYYKPQVKYEYLKNNKLYKVRNE